MINYFSIILIIFLQYSPINCLFKNKQFIKQFSKIEDYEEAFKKKEFKIGFTLIFSTWCGHCKNFSYRYTILSELFHNYLFFYALTKDSNYRKIFDIRGYPSIFFYSNEKYSEYNSVRTVHKLSQFIREKIGVYKCTEIPYSLIDIVYNEVYQNSDRNLVIGYFHNNSDFINSFISITNNLINEHIDLCYYCTNYMFLKNDTTDQKYNKLHIYQDIKDNEVKSYSRNKGNNSFIFNKSQNNNEYNYEYEKFLFNKVINTYADIKDSNSLSELERMKDKEFVFFVYNNENIKQKFINIINELNEITFYKNDSLYYYILFNKANINTNFLELQNDNIYLISNNLLQITIIVDINMIKEKIKENNLKYRNNMSKNISNIERKQFTTYNIIKENKTKIDNESFVEDNVNNKQTINTTNNNSNTEKKEIKKSTNNNKSNLEKKESRNITINSNKNESSNLININSNIDNNTNSMNNPDEPDIVEEKDLIYPYSNNTNSELNKSKENSSNIDDKSKQNSEIYQKNDILNINIDKNAKKIKLNNTLFTKDESNQKENIEPEKSNKILYILLSIIIFIMAIYYIFTKYLCVGFIKVYDSQIIEFNQSNNKLEIV